jgi:hypothetical protein
MGAGKSAAGYFLRILDSYNFIELGVIMGINFDVVRGEIRGAYSV